jgi:hypothetical protein
MRRLAILALSFFFLLSSGLAQAQSPAQAASSPESAAQADQKAAQNADRKIEVVYFIYYGNFDCQVIQPKLAKFESELPPNVEFEILPVVVSRGQVGEDEFYTVNQYADLFFVLDFFGQEKLLRNRIFETVMDTLANTGEFALVDIDYQMGFLTENDLTVNEYREAVESVKVDQKIEKALDYIEKFDINSVPSMVVDGQTLVTYNPKKGADQFFQAAWAAINVAANPKAKTKPKTKTASKISK